ncbi:MAG: pantetheine-phosphate adenylyltransferase [Firmicutes bacterium]|jgi:pantetheine-phosphate adenylyltransferase|nr:pantetheine-phosphate adenylyltransferase [Bacillota bacterium]
MKIAVCPGSFDPVTYGHLDIITRACDLFDRIYVAVLDNPAKQALFTAEERVELLRKATEHLDIVVCEQFGGLVVEYAKRRGAVAIVRGLRAVTDFEYELKMASMNHHLDKDVETVFMMTSNEWSFLSSSAVKEVASLGGDISAWVPPCVAEALTKRFVQAHRD